MKHDTARETTDAKAAAAHFRLEGALATATFATALADALYAEAEASSHGAGGAPHPLHLALEGELGAGKTSLARSFIRRLARRRGVHAGCIKSPSYALLHSYELGGLTLRHYDFYRLAREEDVWELAFEDALTQGTTLMEWPQRLGTLLPRHRLHLHLAFQGARARLLVLQGHGHWRGRLPRLSSPLQRPLRRKRRL